jgi:hypothetical protein
LLQVCCQILEGDSANWTQTPPAHYRLRRLTVDKKANATQCKPLTPVKIDGVGGHWFTGGLGVVRQQRLGQHVRPLSIVVFKFLFVFFPPIFTDRMVDRVEQLLEAAVHQILFTRGVYPPGTHV